MNPHLIPAFLQKLAAHSSASNLANPYHQASALQNLEAYLSELCASGYSGHLFIGEAPGYRGCAITGIPFSSEQILRHGTHPFLSRLRPALRITGATTENTATIVWNNAPGLTQVPAFWNAFPFHPHTAGNPNSNRKPTASEIGTGLIFLHDLINILTPCQLVAVGNVADNLLAKNLPTHSRTKLRHPSFGGAMSFSTGCKRLGIP